jgi:hypothetical protein
VALPAMPGSSDWSRAGPPIDVVARTVGVKVTMYQSVYCDRPELRDPDVQVIALQLGTKPAARMPLFAGSIVILKAQSTRTRSSGLRKTRAVRGEEVMSRARVVMTISDGQLNQ